jgi:carboxylesterase type B
MSQLPYVWGDPRNSTFDPAGDDESLSRFMRGAWVSFVAKHNPNRKGQPYWPDYRYEKSNMGFKIRASAAEPDTYRQEGIQIWIDQRISGCSGLLPP